MSEPTQLVNLLDLLEATGNQADADLAQRFRDILNQVEAQDIELGGY